LARHDIENGNIQEALDAAIHEICLAMTPLSPEELTNPANKAYPRSSLGDDVVLVCGGKVLAVVVATPSGPQVFRFYSPVSQR
jgi:hypothetical protein